MTLSFTKAHGTGNDFVVLLDLDDTLHLTDGLVRSLCDRRLGVGADGVLRIGSSQHADVFMDYRNADGSIVEMCGNGVRVVAKYVMDRSIVAGDTCRIDTRAGVRDVEVRRGADGMVETVVVDMGPPTDSHVEVVDVEGASVELVPVSIGNPHAVLRVDDVGTARVHTLGPLIERHPRFPAGVNVEFAQVRSPRDIDLRVWERGVGETAACGTGACATQVALHRLGLVADAVTVHLPGGALNVAWSEGAVGVMMTGPAVEVASGELDDAWLAAARREVTS